MVADIAATFGKTAQLNRQMMIFCLFRHGAAMIVRDVVARVGERVVVKQASLRVIQQTLSRIGVHVTQKAVGKTLSRWLPIVGPILIGSYSLVDTRIVGKTALDTFSRQIEIEPDDIGAPSDLRGEVGAGLLEPSLEPVDVAAGREARPAPVTIRARSGARSASHAAAVTSSPISSGLIAFSTSGRSSVRVPISPSTSRRRVLQLGRARERWLWSCAAPGRRLAGWPAA